ncbi:YdeI/OmpD-associated family protein [Haloferula sargassicola]
MTMKGEVSKFEAELLRPAGSDGWAFLVLPKEVSESLPRRGRTSVEGTVAGKPVAATLEPDGQLSHWLRLDAGWLDAAGVSPGDQVEVRISPMDPEPEPAVPDDLAAALAEAPEAREVWDATTTLARVDWIHWIETAKQAKTRAKRVAGACDMLAKGKKRVCCFDPSGFYSKAFKVPECG